MTRFMQLPFKGFFLGFLRLVCVAVLAAALNGCIAENATFSAGISSVPQASSSSESSSSSEPSVMTCAAPLGLSITDIDSVTDWINAMPKPLSLACFLQSLPRPLYYNATKNVISAQPAIGQRSPRVFFLFDDLVLTVATQEPVTRLLGSNERVWDVDGERLLEMSMRVPAPELCNPQSIKAELKFPVTETLPRNAPYAGVESEFFVGSSNCIACHSDEVVLDIIDGVNITRSEMLRGGRSNTVSLSYMLNQYATCDIDYDENEWYRCGMLEAIFAHGQIIWQDFPLDIDTQINAYNPRTPNCD